ncbi:SEC59/DGK1/VTE5 family protein [[Phormidium] sp. LEGE 05292]|uniref:diacylglycerol/polyprenol kinase family protein n=1 Tax=[Phormidium] sp. LEGE 05292 TaxID=767427 RepID=UPI002AD57ADB|nr:SEC59/DGK1/VTE5 family protein [Phormidium sp. LEGE 05292]
MLNISFISSLWFKIAIAAVWVGAIVLTAELLHRYTTTDPEKIRKVVHIGTGQVILLAWWLEIPAWVGIAASILASTITLLSYKFPILPGINSVGRKSLGTFFYALSIGILVAWFWQIQQPQYAAIGILVMTWGDGLAALIGQKYGKHPYKIGGIQKSWEGSLTMTVVSFVVTSLILLAVQGNIWQIYVVSIAVALVATALEAFSKLGVDNLTVPVGSAALSFLLMEILQSSL